MDAFLIEINKKNISDEIKKVLKEKDMDAFLIEINKKNISDEIKKVEDLSIISTELVILPEQIVTKSIPVCKTFPPVNKSFAERSIESSLTDKQTKLSSTEVGDGKINKAFDIQIPKLFLEAILMESSEIMAQNIVDLFRVEIKLKCKEILCWYCYYKAYEN
ncbi:hypothetical protein RhiirA4_458075 [Rhizophagus irregularis]|uniref:Uncharacterized protein n=1 Tax=Rhizophagus irregularis TaxID=588596 RepID=A0A2I1GBE6_9GLOM|nr:hypothetical protein RhiirA4_458075 [Rhizophagus irregularis]